MKGMIGSAGTTGRPFSKRMGVPALGGVSFSYCGELVAIRAAVAFQGA
jgi:hypothetical protein